MTHRGLRTLVENDPVGERTYLSVTTYKWSSCPSGACHVMRRGKLGRKKDLDGSQGSSMAPCFQLVVHLGSWLPKMAVMVLCS